MSELNPERQERAKQYARQRRQVWLLDMAFGGIFAAAWILAGWAVQLRDGLEAAGIQAEWLRIALFGAAFAGLYAAITLPLSYYRSFLLPHRFGQSTQTKRGWVIDQIKAIAVGAPIGLLMLELLYTALRLAGESWWIWVAAGMLVFSVLLANLAPILIMPLFNKYVHLDEAHKDLAQRLMRLAERAKTRVRGVFKFDMSKRTRAANAALTGIGNTRRIILGDTLIDEFSADEIETILAHELGHHVHRDIPLLIAFGTAVTTAGLYLAGLVHRWTIASLNLHGPADVAGLPLLMLILGAYGLVTMPLQNVLSRWREDLADRYALEATGRPDAFASAMKRLANQNLAEANPAQWVVVLFYSHPPLADRIARAEGWRRSEKAR